VFLSFSQDFLPVAYERGKQVADDATRAGPDLDRNSHAGQNLDGPALDLHLRAVEYDARGVDQLLAVGFARFAFAVTGDDDGERLRGRDHPSDRMHHELLNDPVDWRSQHLQLGLAVGLDHVLGEARRLLFDFGQFVEWSNPDSWQLARR